ncbi:DHH family protein [Eremomyces bilateralis CBS 781.70]|uniref:DHH family protein n=1 Tax=Eremomyces bilateralis CBS 781.70 TaxID=1392243 RepID=A0A6G1FVP8_9PEZI|nr:DHH family protein [Eremomyces bilateralis CBS 781.70]KAF1809975.1 DHH family protein [Eremomyces bilateralis CBS 781.70]
MKRSAPLVRDNASNKRLKHDIPAYHLTPQQRDAKGQAIWPAPREQIHHAQKIILDCANSKQNTLLVPDKDADGLTSGAILYTTLVLLGLPQDRISVHLLSKGNNVFSEVELAAVAAYEPSYIFVLDHGSRVGPPLLSRPHTALVIDHHQTTPSDFPTGAAYVTACDSPPVATSSLLTYLICEALHSDVESKCDWLAIIGTHGDLGTNLKWEPPFPNMADPLKRYSKKALNEAVSALNAPRRTAEYDVSSAWDALRQACDTDDPVAGLKKLLQNSRLRAAREEIRLEVERCTHAPPKFGRDGRVAVLRIRSPCQVHPIIATRWAGFLAAKKLEIIMVANDGYLEGKVNFSCRVAKSARGWDRPPNVIELLEEYANQADDEKLRTRLGENFARGHKEASGGIVDKDVFEGLIKTMKIGEKPPAEEGKSGGTPKKSKGPPPQRNTLLKYFEGKSQDNERL